MKPVGSKYQIIGNPANEHITNAIQQKTATEALKIFPFNSSQSVQKVLVNCPVNLKTLEQNISQENIIPAINTLNEIPAHQSSNQMLINPQKVTAPVIHSVPKINEASGIFYF